MPEVVPGDCPGMILYITDDTNFSYSASPRIRWRPVLLIDA